MLLIPLIVATALAYAYARRLPDQYRSETLIMLVPQRVPESYVRSTVTARIEDRLATLSDQILSRSQLERIILDLDLYPAMRRVLPMEDVVQRMRVNDITIRTEGDQSFRVSYISQDARTAQRTTERLASLFIEETLRERENVAEDTNQFLDSQLEDAKRRLVGHERQLEAYRSRYAGELPSQANSNLQAIQSAQNQLQTLADATNRARERRLLLERQLVELESDPTLIVTNPATGQPVANAVPAGSTAQQLEQVRARLQLLQTTAKPDHPDVRLMQRTIRDLEAKLEEERNAPDEPGEEHGLSPAETLRRQRTRDVRTQIEDIDRQLGEQQEQEKRLHATIADLQAKLDAVPRRESDLVALTRDYTTLQTTYQSLLAKREEANLAANLERRNIGQQFRVLDPARVPERPFSPNRVQIQMAGAGAGLAMGLLLVAFLEYRDSTFRTEDEIVRVLSLPVLALVPSMRSSADREAKKRRSLVVAAAVVVLLSSAALAYWRLQS
jgi:polysaccharide chain length determinant protein (PEP-CTERM system associated)